MHRRFTVEEIDNGWLVKTSELGSDKLVSRHCFTNKTLMLDWLMAQLKGIPNEKP